MCQSQKTRCPLRKSPLGKRKTAQLPRIRSKAAPLDEFPALPCSEKAIPCSGERNSLFGREREFASRFLKMLRDLAPAIAEQARFLGNTLIISLFSGISRALPSRLLPLTALPSRVGLDA